MNFEFFYFIIRIFVVSGYEVFIFFYFVYEWLIDDEVIFLLFFYGWLFFYFGWEKVFYFLVLFQDLGIQFFYVVVFDMFGFGFSLVLVCFGFGFCEMGFLMDLFMGVFGYKCYGIVIIDLGWEVGMWMVKYVG